MRTVATIEVDGFVQQVRPLHYCIDVVTGNEIVYVEVVEEESLKFWHLVSEIEITSEDKYVKGRCFSGRPTMHCEVHYGRCMSHKF